MKKLFVFLMVLGLVILGSGMALATSVSLSGTLSGTDFNNVKDDGDGNHAYAMRSNYREHFLLVSRVACEYHWNS